MVALVDFLSKWGPYVWTLLAFPGTVLAFVAAYEGNRTVRLSIAEGNTRAPGARLLRLVGVGLGIVQFAFCVVGVLAIVNTLQGLFVPAAGQATSLVVRRLLGTVVFFVAPPVLIYVTWRVLRFVDPRRGE